MAIIPDDGRRENHNHEQVIRRNDDGSINSERLDRHEWTESIRQKGHCRRTRGHSYGPDRPLPSVAHSHMPVSFVLLDACALPPCINQDENVVCCYSQDYKYDEHVQVGVVGHSKSANAENGGQTEGKSDEQHTYGSQEERPEMNQKVEEHKHYREGSI